MKPVLIITILLLNIMVNFNCFAQVYYFGYDANGNRISRTITLPPGLKSTDNKESTDNQVFNEVIDDLEINLYPNPTKGEITVVLKNFEKEQSSMISLYDYSGRLLQIHNNIQESNTIDLSGLPRATYILRIVAGDKKTEWKVIKE
jgi:hypothetical protein